MINHRQSLDTFETQAEYVLNNYSFHGFSHTDYNNVVLAGLGGSGIAARYVKNLVQSRAALPVEVINDYNLPEYANKKTWVILASYSGTTEETLSVFNQADHRGCTIVCISSGGDLKNLATDKGYKFYELPAGFQPRMALGLGLGFSLLSVCDFFGLGDLKQSYISSSAIYKDKEEMKKQSNAIIDKIDFNNKFVFIADNKSEALAIRTCQQIQENAKLEAFWHLLPECNHNVLESYYGKLNSNFILLNGNSHPRTNIRFDFTQERLLANGNRVFRVNFEGGNMQELLTQTYIFDWFSILLSEKAGADNMKVENISGLKNYLNKL